MICPCLLFYAVGGQITTRSKMEISRNPFFNSTYESRQKYI